MSELGQALLSPLGLFFCLLILGLSVKRFRRIVVTCACLSLLFFSLPIVSQTLILSLESRHPPIPMSNIPETEWAILLGGGLYTSGHGIPRSELGSSGDRLAATAELFDNKKIKRILISSGAGIEHHSEARQTADRLIAWGVPATALVIEEKSQNTIQNAQFSQPLIEGSDTSPSLLVTSAIHLPRARAIFCSQGIDVVGVAANHWVRPFAAMHWQDWIPSATSLSGSTRALKEYLGIVYYALTNRLRLDALNYDHSCVRSQA